MDVIFQCRNSTSGQRPGNKVPDTRDRSGEMTAFFDHTCPFVLSVKKDEPPPREAEHAEAPHRSVCPSRRDAHAQVLGCVLSSRFKTACQELSNENEEEENPRHTRHMCPATPQAARRSASSPVCVGLFPTLRNPRRDVHSASAPRSPSSC